MGGLNKDGWVMISKSTDSTDINILKLKLADSGVEAITFDHQDSMLTSLNDTNYSVSLYVHESDVDKAKKIIEN